MRKLAILLAVTLAITTLPGIASADIISQDDLTGSIVFTYDGLGLDSSNVTKVEVTNSAFTSVGPITTLFRPDYYNYGFNMSIAGLPGLSAARTPRMICRNFLAQAPWRLTIHIAIQTVVSTSKTSPTIWSGSRNGRKRIRESTGKPRAAARARGTITLGICHNETTSPVTSSRDNNPWVCSLILPC